MQARPLLKEELPEEVRQFYLWDEQWHGERSQMMIPKICSVCSERSDGYVSHIRTNIKKGRRITGMCRKCSITPGPHLTGLRAPKGKEDDGYIDKRGYRVIYRPYHPGSMKTGYIAEHRYLMEEKLGRTLTPLETVHHINGDRADNRLENLQLRSSAHGQGQKWSCLDCGGHNIVAIELD
jgi:hypothetical protein